MLNRRKFLQQTTLATGGLVAANGFLTELHAEPAVQKLTILHTNDVHSRLEPFPMDGSRNQGLGGVASRAKIIEEIRATEDQVLLLDAGDIFQGTPYFNFYKGEADIKAMAAMRYDAVTMGNHDFDMGLENFSTQLQHANFPVLLCNYDFASTAMEHKYQPYKIFKKGKLKIGVTGVGIELKGLVADNLYGNTQYLDPVSKATETADYLKNREGCDMVVCLSHLGFHRKDNKMEDEAFAKESKYIDLIIGGHTHTFFDAPVVYQNKSGDDVIVNQVGWAGIILGRLDFIFEPRKKKNLHKFHSVVIAEKTSE